MMQPVTSITILYDEGCGLCAFAKDWILGQRALIQLKFLPTGSREAAQTFPQLPVGELAVIANTGEVWLDKHAWVVCLWALRDFRGLALRLTSSLLSLVSREVFLAVSRNRLAVSRLLGLRSPSEIEQELRRVAVPQCRTELP